MITCIAIDDEPFALEIIKTFAAQIDGLDLRKTFTRTSEARSYLAEYPVDLIFLDIQMPDISGIEFYEQSAMHCAVIFTTAYSQYAITGFDLKAVDYLLKPFSLERFSQAAAQAKVYLQAQQKILPTESQSLQVRADYALVSIPLSDILYLETMDDYIKIHVEGRKPILTLMRMRQMEEKLPQPDFMRIHRSFIVPISRIEGVRNKLVQIAGLEIPIGTTYEAAFWSAFQAL